jgi:hypothetical protein
VDLRGGIDVSDPVGCTGTVSLRGAIAPGRPGEVLVEVGGGTQAFYALDANGGAIEASTQIVVVSRVGPRTVLVTRMYDEGEK